VIALKNANVNKSKKFMLDLLSFVSISALIIVGASVLGEYITKKYYSYAEADLQMIMMSIMVMITTANYLSVALHKGERISKCIYSTVAYYRTFYFLRGHKHRLLAN
jgi:sorbitol-specific phosphotransferase system component IIBC